MPLATRVAAALEQSDLRISNENVSDPHGDTATGRGRTAASELRGHAHGHGSGACARENPSQIRASSHSPGVSPGRCHPSSQGMRAAASQRVSFSCLVKSTSDVDAMDLCLGRLRSASGSALYALRAHASMSMCANSALKCVLKSRAQEWQ